MYGGCSYDRARVVDIDWGTCSSETGPEGPATSIPRYLDTSPKNNPDCDDFRRPNGGRAALSTAGIRRGTTLGDAGVLVA